MMILRLHHLHTQHWQCSDSCRCKHPRTHCLQTFHQRKILSLLSDLQQTCYRQPGKKWKETLHSDKYSPPSLTRYG